METEWMPQGRCREIPPGTFFPSDGVGVEVARHREAVGDGVVSGEERERGDLAADDARVGRGAVVEPEDRPADGLREEGERHDGAHCAVHLPGRAWEPARVLWYGQPHPDPERGAHAPCKIYYTGTQIS